MTGRAHRLSQCPYRSRDRIELLCCGSALRTKNKAKDFPVEYVMQISGLDNCLQNGSAIPAGVCEEDPALPRRCRVLVVDDDEVVRASLTTLLRTREFEVESAASGAVALRIMAAAPCQILLIDWHMPNMDGLSLCQSVRDSRSEGYVYVLLHTVRDGEEALLAGLAAGADDYVVRGAPVAELLARLEVGRRIIGRPAWNRRRDKKWRPSFADPLIGARNLHYLVRRLPRELARSRCYG
jgi:PleD family two-component response regulator